MRRLAGLVLAVAASIGVAGCEDSASAEPFCDAVGDFTRQSVSMFSLIGSDDPAADLREKQAEARRVLDRMDDTAPGEIETDVRRLTDGWRAVLDGRMRAVPPETGQRVTEWTGEHCDEQVRVPAESPYPAPTGPPAPPAPPAPPSP